MANTDRAYGFSPKGQLLNIGTYTQDADDTTAMFIGDVADMENDGNVSPAAAASVAKLGAALTFSAASTASTAANPMLIADNPHQLYMAQDDAAATGTQSDIGRICDHVAGAGDTNTNLSGHELGFGSLGTTDGGFKLLDVIRREDNSVGNNADWECQLNTDEGLLNLAAGI